MINVKKNGIQRFIQPRWENNSDCIFGRYVWLVESPEYISPGVEFIQHKFLWQNYIFSNEGEFLVVKAPRKEDICSQFCMLTLESKNGRGLNTSFLSEIKVHLLCLKEELSRYFWDVSNSFLCSNLSSHLNWWNTRNCTRRIDENYEWHSQQIWVFFLPKI